VRRTTLLASSVTILSCVLSAAPSVAHHAFSAEFDAARPVELQGKVVRMEWINPHTWIHVEVEGPGELAGTWRIEGGPPNTLYRRGFNKTSLEPGTVIFVTGYQAKDGSQTANGREVKLADGRKLFLGSSGTGAPRDGADPSEAPP
jgi:Family of unknown function (DUF6152)